jgi:predicted RNA-binding Zn ribbon-like protein
MQESPSAPSSASSSAPSVLVAVLVHIRESFGNAVQDDEAKDVRPQRIEDYEGECADEQPDHPIVVMVKVKHQGCCVSTASLSTPSSCSPQ